MSELPRVREEQIYMVANAGIGIPELVNLIQAKVYAEHVNCEFLIPYDKGGVASYLMENATIVEQEYRADGIYIRANCYSQDAAKYAIFTI